jgi:hypothetical protein
VANAAGASCAMKNPPRNPISGIAPPPEPANIGFQSDCMILGTDLPLRRKSPARLMKTPCTNADLATFRFKSPPYGPCNECER